MWKCGWLSLGVIYFAACTWAGQEFSTAIDVQRQSRFSVFHIVKFLNDNCKGNNDKIGTCYTEQECSVRGGSNSGACANGYGICCTFTLECGDKATENVTYFESTGTESGYCQSRVCSVSSNICQIRLDFNDFVINQPSTDTLNSGRQVGGVPSNAAVFPVANVGQCNTDSFSVVSPGVMAPSAICGTNTGEHMYVNIQAGGCIDLLFALGSDSTETRSWNIMVTQYHCSYDNLAPSGCTKYYFGSYFGVIKTYNFDRRLHLADQKDIMCIRRERGQCRICYWTTDPGDFDVSGTSQEKGLVGTSSACCNYGRFGSQVHYDCAIIPGASKASGPGILRYDRFCGGGNPNLAGGLFTQAGNVPKTICSKVLPFKVSFISDNYEFALISSQEAAAMNNGFKLGYGQTRC